MFGVTTKEKGHIHAVYVSQESGQGVVSPGPKDGHNHQVIFDAEYSQQWIVQPSEDGHTHFVQDLPTKSEKEEKKTDSEIIAEVHALYSEAKQLESTSIKNGKDSYDMYMNRQWDETVKREAEALGKATVTVNELRAKIDLLVGYNNQNRTDVSFKPKEDSDAIDADLANILTKHVFENLSLIHIPSPRD